MDNLNTSTSREWRAIQSLAVIAALYTSVFMLKMGEPDQLWWWLLACVFFVWLYSPFLLLIRFGMKNKGNIPALRIVFIAMLINALGGFYLSYEAFIVSKTDAGGAMFFAVLPMLELVVSSIGIAVAKTRAK
jgi:hypothetical protein